MLVSGMNNLIRLLGEVFTPRPDKKYRWFSWAWLALLYLVGIYLWGKFYNWGNFPINFHDWADVTLPRFTFLQNAVNQGVLPLHIASAKALAGLTDRYLAIPDAYTAPQALLLAFMPIGVFVLVNQVLLYTAGFAGLLWLRRKYSLSPFVFTIFFLLFDFNGHILAHSGIGHVTWGGYFLFPWFIGLVFNMLGGERGWGWIAKMAVLLLVTWLQGSFHQVVWCLILLGLLALTSKKNFWPCVGAAVASIMVCMVRVLPAAAIDSELSKYYGFVGAYSSVTDLWNFMVTLTSGGQRTTFANTSMVIGNWELSLYVGLVGAAFLLFFGVYRWIKNRKQAGRYPELMLPLLVMAAMSIGVIYKAFRILPLFNGERVSSRIICMPFVFLVVIAAVEFQRWLDETPMGIPARLAQIVVLVVATHDLWQDFKAWKVLSSAYWFKPSTSIDLTMYGVINRPDPRYTEVLILGAIVSVLSLAALCALAWREKRQKMRIVHGAV
jgi:hypothetical protein